MNFTETFQDFSTRVGPTDLALYAGVGLVLWVLFGEKLAGLKNLFNKVQLKLPAPSLPNLLPVNNNDKFFQLLVSWKKTRDLAVEVGCDAAVKVADDMFPYLSPSVCNKQDKVS